jgi:hypothetical protein
MWLVLGLIAVAIIAVAVGVLAWQGRKRSEHWPLVAKDVLTPRERECHGLLMTQYPGHHIFVQVALSQLLDVQAGVADEQSIRNQFNQLVADFVLCRADYSVVAVVELDDSAHASLNSRELDARKDKAVHSAGLRLVRIPAGSLPAGPDLRRLIDGERPATAAQTILAPNGNSEPPLQARGASLAIGGAVVIAVLMIGGAVVYWSHSTGHVSLPSSAPPPSARHSLTGVTPTHEKMPAKVVAPEPVKVVEQQPVQDAKTLPEQQAMNARSKQKERAWAAFYKPYPSCEHPPTWEDQVECGNRYIRARREFEKQWDASPEAKR